MGSSKTQLSFRLLPALPHPSVFCAHSNFNLLFSRAQSSLSWGGFGGLQQMQNWSQAIEVEDSWELGGLVHVPSVTELMGHEPGEGIWAGLISEMDHMQEYHLLLSSALGGRGGKGSNGILAGVVFTGSVGAVCTQTPWSKLLGVY